mgnify:CR=1 FL=1
MEVQVSKENICINKLVAEKKELIFVNSDMIVPDSKPDILNTINVSGNVCLYKKEVTEDKVKIEGCINTYVMYLPDSKDDNLRGLNCNLDFSESIAVQGAKEGMLIKTKCTIKDIECKVINGRKVSIKASVEVNIKIYSNEDVEIINKITNIDDIQTLQKDFSVNSLVGNGRTSVYAKDTLNIEQTDELAEILKVDISLVDKDIKISYNKVLAKAEAEVKIMYLTEDNRIGRVTGRIPIVGFIDIQNISEDNICDVNYEMKNMICKPNPSEEHSIYIELEIEESCMAFERKQINLIQDLYSPTCNLEFSQKRVSSSADKCDMTKDFTVKDKISIPEISDVSLLDVEVEPNLVNTTITNSKITYSGDLNLNFIFTNDSTVNSRRAKMPFEISVDNENRSDEINVEADISVQKTDFDIQSRGEATGEVELTLETRACKNVSMNIIDNVEQSDEVNAQDEDYDSLILYIVKPGDSLWKIAKKFNSTVDEIAKMNGIEDTNMIIIGQKIYIPKFQYIRKENSENAREQIII